MISIKNLDRYKTFTFLQPHELFSKLFENKDYRLVQLHDATECGDDIVGFAGVFSWINNEIIPEDGDSYTPNMMVIAYDEFEYNGNKCLEILVEDW